MSEWQPIKTAPKDGRSILVMRNKNTGSMARDCHAGNTAVVEYVQDLGEGYWMCYLPFKTTPVWFEPTHWMPLPRPLR